MTWIMTSKKVPGGIEVCLGDIRIASVTFERDSRAALWLLEPEGSYQGSQHESVSEAFHQLHERLNSPPPEGFELPKFKKG